MAALKFMLEFVKSTLLGGLVIVLPIGLLIVMAVKAVHMLREALAPVSESLTSYTHFPTLLAIAALLAVCFIAGLIARTGLGRGTGSLVERLLLNRIPGYSLIRSFTRQVGNVEASSTFAPALAEIENSLVPAFIVEEHADGRCTIFVPAAPTPGVGSIYIMTSDRVHRLDTSLLKTVKCVSQWGAGSAELLRAMKAPPHATEETPHP